MRYSVGLAYILWFLSGFGIAGFHRFYLGKIPTAVLWLFTGGLFGVGSIYDFFTLGRQVRDANLRYASLTGTGAFAGANIYIQPGAGTNLPGIPPAAKASIEKIALSLAKKNNGIVSPGEVALESDYTTDECRAELEKLAQKGICDMRIRSSGVIVYHFPEFEKDDSGFESGF